MEITGQRKRSDWNSKLSGVEGTNERAFESRCPQGTEGSVAFPGANQQGRSGLGQKSFPSLTEGSDSVTHRDGHCPGPTGKQRWAPWALTFRDVQPSGGDGNVSCVWGGRDCKSQVIRPQRACSCYLVAYFPGERCQTRNSKHYP